ncbi:phospholipase A [Aliidiomarina soli]|uniref:Phospholipase A1 n=1 Tax=Aliidiomarina soli TaxID=1928574 RepID=A0A432WLS2_9GAMM|nr:phospholipase A [Aliidiomarina soli]RUO34725.1 phospholipase [Aliidiomarina soli]
MINRLPPVQLGMFTLLLGFSLSTSAADSNSQDEESRRGQQNGEEESRVDRRAEAERDSADNPYVLTPHRQNYVLPAKYTTRTNPDAFDSIPNARDIENVELQLQFSFKYPIDTNLFGTKHSLWVAYTQQSYWQAYNGSASRPFRETNYEPEVFVAFDLGDWSFLGVNPKFLNLSLNHQSNGRSEPGSRSWNRVIAELVFERDDLVFAFRPWWRIPENSEDDNPDIHKYLGYGDFSFVYTWDELSVDVTLRNNFRSDDNRGALRVGFSFPLWENFQGYVQYFNGYGESLIDYDYHTQSIGVGIILTNWL